MSPPGDDPASDALALFSVTRLLLAELADAADEDNDTRTRLVGLARIMTRGGWRWGPAVLAALGDAPDAFQHDRATTSLHVWNALGEWADFSASPPGESWPVEPVEARARLVKMLGKKSEPRPQQADYASAASAAFLPRDEQDAPRLVLAEAGTGVGKTLGYLAPATVWAEKNDGAGVDLDLHAQPAAPDRPRARHACFPTRTTSSAMS